MKQRLIPIIISSGIALTGLAQQSSPLPAGYVDRAASMLADGNYTGCIDQCRTALLTGVATPEKALWLEACAMYLGGMPAASEKLNAFCRRFPQSPSVPTARLYIASLVFFDGDYAAALPMLDAVPASSLEPMAASQLAYRRAYCLMQTGKLDDARSLFSSLSANKQLGNAATFYIGYIDYLKGDYTLAQTYLDKADRSTSPGNRADYYLAQIAFKQGDYQRALDLAQPLIERQGIEPQFAQEATLIAGEAMFALGNQRGAVKYLRPYVEAHLEDAPLSAKFIVGCDSYNTGRYEQAVELLAPVTELEDAMGQCASFTLGQSYMAQGNARSALMAFEKAIKNDADAAITEAAYYNYAVATIDGGRIPFGSTVKTLEEFIKRYPRSVYASTVQNYIVKGYMRSEDYEGALRSLNALPSSSHTRDTEPLRQRVLFMLGTRAFNAGNPSQAIAYLKEAETLSRHDAQIALQTLYWLADAEYSAGRHKDAEAHFKQYLAKTTYSNPNRPLAVYNLAYSQFAQRRYDEARKNFNAALSLNALPAEAKTDALCRLADTDSYSGNMKEALAKYTEAFNSSPATGDYPLFQMAMMEGHMKHNDKKVSLLDRFAGLFPNSPLRPEALTEKALAQSSMGKSADAIATYETIVKAYPATKQGRNALLQLAIINDNAGHTDRAIEYYRRVITSHPTSAEASLAVNDLKRIYGQRGEIEVLDQLLESTDGAPKLDAVERNAIIADSILRKARSGSTHEQRLDHALQILDKYPDADAAEEALFIAATSQYHLGMTTDALQNFTLLETKASTPSMRHCARMGVMRAARDMGDHALVTDMSQRILQSSTATSAETTEATYLRASALHALGRNDESRAILEKLSADTSSLYGTRAAFDIADDEYKKGNVSKAETLASQLIDANPPHPYWLARCYVLLSDCLRAKGSDFEADEYLKALRDNYPGTDADIFRMIDQRLAK